MADSFVIVLILFAVILCGYLIFVVFWDYVALIIFFLFGIALIVGGVASLAYVGGILGAIGILCTLLGGYIVYGAIDGIREKIGDR